MKSFLMKMRSTKKKKGKKKSSNRPIINIARLIEISFKFSSPVGLYVSSVKSLFRSSESKIPLKLQALIFVVQQSKFSIYTISNFNL